MRLSLLNDKLIDLSWNELLAPIGSYQNPSSFWSESNDVYHCKVNMAGIKKDNINIKINENLIDVWAEQDGHKYRSWAYIPKQADSSTGKAKYEDGLLTISFDKKEKHKTIELKIN